jgi:hypothetical protein
MTIVIRKFHFLCVSSVLSRGRKEEIEEIALYVNIQGFVCVLYVLVYLCVCLPHVYTCVP